MFWDINVSSLSQKHWGLVFGDKDMNFKLHIDTAFVAHLYPIKLTDWSQWELWMRNWRSNSEEFAVVFCLFFSKWSWILNSFKMTLILCFKGTLKLILLLNIFSLKAYLNWIKQDEDISPGPSVSKFSNLAHEGNNNNKASGSLLFHNNNNNNKFVGLSLAKWTLWSSMY